jgi:uncharacterized protein YdiU (UPF0061 family)
MADNCLKRFWLAWQWFAALGQKTEVKKLADFVIEHYYPQCQGAQKYVDFFNQVVKRTAKMLADS